MKAIVIGGGISGLSACYSLQKKGYEVELHEASDRLGGWMQTKEVDGFRFELGPRTFQKNRCPLLLGMCKDLGLDILYSKGGTRFLWKGGKLRKMQSFWPQLIYIMIKDAFVPKSNLEDETIYDFAVRRCGKKAAELFFDPLAKGVFGGDIRKLSARSCFPFLFQSKWIGKAFAGGGGGGLFTVRGGMVKLVDALKPSNTYLNSSMHEIPVADLVVVALPWQEASKICGVPLELRDERMDVVNFGFHGDILPEKGYGYLIPSTEQEPVLGQIWDSSIFPAEGRTIVTTMVKGDHPKEFSLDALKRHLNVDLNPHSVSIQEARIVQYELNHYEKIARFEAAIAHKFGGRVVLAGNYLRGASVEACVRQAFSLG